MKPISILTLTCLVATLTAARAQLVADGATAIINRISTNAIMPGEPQRYFRLQVE